MDAGSGHCLCGAVRFAFEGPPNWQAHCHCESCRRNCAAPFTSYFGISHWKWRWTGTAPSVYASSSGTKRHFCAVCGTPMAYESDRWPHEIHFYAATLDHPAAYAPTEHVHWDEHLPWISLSDNLPVRRSTRRLDPAEDMAPVLGLLRSAFAYMEGVIDPPSSLHRLTAEGIARHAADEEIWVIEDAGRPVACIFLTRLDDRLYLGKIAIADAFRGQGLTRQLVQRAESRARALGLAALELQSRVELAANHAVFAALGFLKTGETSHEGYDHPTSFTFTKPVAPKT